MLLKAVISNYEYADGEYCHIDHDLREQEWRQYVSPRAELYQTWSSEAAGTGELDILMQGELPHFVSDARVVGLMAMPMRSRCWKASSGIRLFPRLGFFIRVHTRSFSAMMGSSLMHGIRVRPRPSRWEKHLVAVRPHRLQAVGSLAG